MQKVVRDYTTPGHPTAWSGLNVMTRFYRGQFSKAQLNRALEGVDSYTIKRESKPVSVFNPIYTHREASMHAGAIRTIPFLLTKRIK